MRIGAPAPIVPVTTVPVTTVPVVAAAVAPKIAQDATLSAESAPVKLVIAVSQATILKNMKLTVPKGGVAKFYCEVVGQGLQSGEEASTGNCNRNLPRVGDHQDNVKEKCDEVDGFQGVWLRHN